MRFCRFDDPRCVALVVAGVLTAAGVITAEESLPSRVDRLIAAKANSAGVVMAPIADDASFLRRAWLDFAGTTPPVAEARAFLAESSADKRIALIDRLITGAPFADRMAEVFHIELMERRGDDENWKRFLTESFRANKRWDQMVREILSPDFTDEHRRGAGYFITRRLEKEGQQETDYPGLTRDVGRLFVGMDLQCCQCHKHLTVRDYKQADFNGLFVAFQNVKLNEPSGAYATRWVSEGLMKRKFEFTSVLSGVKGETGPRVPLGVEVDLPMLPPDEQWLVPPSSKDGAGVPRFSPLKELAAHLTAPENPFFARNIANRIWWQLIGRGLVEPLDLHHSENPASHPDLLDLLAKEIMAHAFDLKWLIRELALTGAYQRAGIICGGQGAPPDHLFAAGLERPLCAEQLARALLTATGEHERVSTGVGWEGIEGKRYSAADFQKAFVSAFANAGKEPELNVNPTLRGALFLRNDELVLWALERRRGNLLDRISVMTEPAQMAEELYLSVFTRVPTNEEKADLEAYLAKHVEDRDRALSRYLWAMVSSIEFFTNH